MKNKLDNKIKDSTPRNSFDHKAIEKKWQEKWEKEKIYSPNIENAEKKFYNLFMFPYPSAEGLHVGHAFSSTGSDIYGRYMRMLGKTVLQPMGYDSFGIHSENFAIKINDTPWNLIDRATKNYRHQLGSLGHGYDWSRTVTTSDPDYYRWTQWLFVQLFKAGLAYRKKSPVNWCPGCKTVLADEQIMTPAQAGKLPPGYDKIEDVPEGIKVCERSGDIPEVKELEQWFFRITDYADRLLEDQKKIDWSERVAIAQRNWIGKSEGVYFDFKVAKSDKTVQVFTTAIDTVFGATYVVLSPKHPLLRELKIPNDKKENVAEYIKTHQDISEDTSKEKTGVFTGLFVKHPFKDVDLPIWVSDYVLMEYGTGAIMAVPAHDARDHEFAENFDLPIIPVLKPKGGYEHLTKGDGFWDYSEVKAQYGSVAILFDSEEYSNLTSVEAKMKLIERIENEGIGYAKSNYHLRDWLISRQRYWGPPIPMIHCDECERNGKSWFDTLEQGTENNEQRTGMLHKDQSDWNPAGWYPVPENELPVVLPKIEDYKPKGEGKGPLADQPEFYETVCPGCGAKAKRETDVGDTFVDSSWYFLRYPTVGSETEETYPFDPEITKKWLPVDLYFGGAEHAVLHLMYARFVTKVLYDLNLINFDEPFPKFFAHGLLIKDGAKMSKSRGNVVNPDEYIEKFGADTLRLYFMFMGPMDGYPDFRDAGVEGMRRFVERVWNLFSQEGIPDLNEKEQKDVQVKMHKTINRVTTEVENFRYNTAIAAIMEYVNTLREYGNKSNELENSSGQSKFSVLSSQLSEESQPVASVSVGTDKQKTDKLETENRGQKTDNWNEALKTLVLLLAPFAPHITEELWEKMREEFTVHKSQWPTFDETMIVDEEVTVVVQINGKLRANLTVPKVDATDKEKIIGRAKDNEAIKKWTEGKEIKKEVFVPGKLVNFVI